MAALTPSELKTILHSKRANLYYLEYCRVLVNGGRVEFVTDEGARSLYWNIPIANTTTLLLGSGTSITQAAMRELAKAGVMVGFCGGNGTPLFSATEREQEVTWLSPQSEYRPTEYLQGWVRFWFDDSQRLQAAKRLQQARLACIRREWLKRPLQDEGFRVPADGLLGVLADAEARMARAEDNMHLLTEEARLTKILFKLACDATGYGQFVRVKRGAGLDPANRFLDQGNYLAYGMAAWPRGTARQDPPGRAGVRHRRSGQGCAGAAPGVHLRHGGRRQPAFSGCLHPRPDPGRSPGFHDRHP
jgi:CRISP-associated protein Cas1